MTPTRPTADQREMLASLRSGRCPACRGPKKPRHTLCLPCYNQLPRALRTALYRRIGEGYERAYREAVTHLWNQADSRDGARP